MQPDILADLNRLNKEAVPLGSEDQFMKGTALLHDFFTTGTDGIKRTTSFLESLVPRIGDLLLSMGAINHHQLQIALAEQNKIRETTGESPLLGQVLLQLDFIEPAMLDQAIANQVFVMQGKLMRQNATLEKKVAERTAELEHALSQLGELQQMKDNFVGAISHELRTPLAHLMGYLDLFRREAFGATGEDQQQALISMDKASKRLLKLVNELITFATAQQGKLEVDLRPVPLKKLVKTALTENLGKARERNIQMFVHIAQPYSVVKADGQKISWVISQLLDNAVKFNQPGGKVYFVAKQRNQRNMNFFVQDTGPGIPTSRLQEVFRAFHQLDGSTTRYAGGVGLGLTLAQQILQTHARELEIISRPGTGTQVMFSLPLAGRKGAS